MKSLTINLYTIEEHPNKEKCFEWLRNNVHDLGDGVLSEFKDSLNALAKQLGTTVDYGLSIVPDRGEYIRFGRFDEYSLENLYNKREEHPLTGVWTDFLVIEGLYHIDVQKRVLDELHRMGEYLYSDIGLYAFAENNEYYFLPDGSMYNF